MDLDKQKCVPCEGGTPPMDRDKISEYKSQINQGWQVIDSATIKREFILRDFKEAIEFVRKVALIAEEQGHHPDIFIFYNRVTLELSTHTIHGLSANDFIVAAKIDKL